MSILSSTLTGKEGKESQIKEWLDEWHISGYELEGLESAQGQCFFIINIKQGNVNLSGYRFGELPEFIQFGKLEGGSCFICSHSELESMRGFPLEVGGDLDCSFSKIRSLSDVNIKVNREVAFCGLPFSEAEIRSKLQILDTCRVYC